MVATPFLSVELNCYITLKRHILYGDVLICIQHVMRRDDRVPGMHVHLPHTAGQGSGTKEEDEDERSTPPYCAADLQVMAFFSFTPLSLKED